MDDNEKQPMPVIEKTAATPPPLPAGSILGTEKPAEGAKAPHAAPPPAPTAAPSPATSHAIAAVQAAAIVVQDLPNPTRNIQTALRMLNDAMGLLQKG
jgi:hypothetical protein